METPPPLSSNPLFDKKLGRTCDPNLARFRRDMPDLLHSLKLQYLKLAYKYLSGHSYSLMALPLIMIALVQLSRPTLEGVWIAWESPRIDLLSLSMTLIALVLVLTLYMTSRPARIYLLDFACFKPNDDRKVSKDYFMINSALTGFFTSSSLDFQEKILERSGLGQETYFPPAVMNLPPNPCMDEAHKEAEAVMFGAVDELIKKTHVKFKDIGILIVNCSAYCPTPSLTSVIVNRYKLRGNILSYNLAGMGCSAGVIAVDLAKHLLQVHRHSYALVVSTENITLNWYTGNEKSKLVSNCLFRMGGAAVLLSNLSCDRHRAKYNLVQSVRTHRAAEDRSFLCVQQEEDADGTLGVILARELMKVAADALKTNITTLGPRVLPIYEQLLFVASLLGRKVLKMNIKPYIPDFKRAFEHFCIHSGGRAVLDEVENNLHLSEWHMEPSRMTLYRFGNTSSSSVWYALAYTEAKGRIRKGDRIWQIGFGSGFKCNSAVWRARRTIQADSVWNCWSEFIDKFPVRVPSIE